ncbi:MAG: CAP domain-containing protein [Corynebacterium sp.]|nr:CAP domain-containing protein [Corynebacterium sp.]
MKPRIAAGFLGLTGLTLSLVSPSAAHALGSSELPTLPAFTDSLRCPSTSILHVVRPRVLRNSPVRGATLLDTSFCLMSTNEARQALFLAVNELRTQADLPAFTLNPEADLKSQVWATRLAAENALYHAAFDGISNALYGAENLIRCSQFSTPRECALTWRDSAPHYANIIIPSLRSAGMGISFQTTGWVTAVQQFRY